VGSAGPTDLPYRQTEKLGRYQPDVLVASIGVFASVLDHLRPPRLFGFKVLLVAGRTEPVVIDDGEAEGCATGRGRVAMACNTQ